MSEEKSGGFFSTLKSFVVTEDEKAEPAEAPSHTITPISPLPKAPPPPSLADADPELIKKIDERATAQLQAPVEKVAGTYAEFMASMDALSEAVPDMNARQKAVIKLMMKKNIPLAKILSDLDACIGALEEEGRTFRNVSEDHLTKKIGGMEQEAEKIEQSISEKSAMVSKLEAEIAALRATKDSRVLGIQSAKSDANLVQSRFTSIYNSTHAAMTSQRKQISDLVSKGA